MSWRSKSLQAAGILLLAATSFAPTAEAADPAIRKLAGKHITLFTDLPSSPEIDDLPMVFDQAFPQWCAYFGLDAKQHADWQPRAYLMKSKDRFIASGMVAASASFTNGISTGHELWLYEQTSPYYRRHLLLHEGTHCIMNTLLGSCGPPWYGEGMAELLATHRWRDGKLTLNYFPHDRSEVPKLGRVEMVATSFAAGDALTLNKVLAFDHTAHSNNEAYGWCWAAAAFLDGHPRYRERFRQLPKLVQQPDFSQRVERLFAKDWPLLLEEWQIFVANIDYGYDFQRMRLAPAAGNPLPAAGVKVSVAADRGWQSSGIRLEAGMSYQLEATGRYQVGDKPRVWWSEPGGVTLQYFHSLPLGILVAAVRPDEPNETGASPLIRPLPVGSGTTLAPKQSGTLYLRINDSAGRMGDNAGAATVNIAGSNASPRADASRKGSSAE